MPQIRVARLTEVGKPLEVGTVEKPHAGPTDVLVRVEACSLVPNSANVVKGRTPLELPELPCIFGLDVAGTIEAVGEHVINLKVGDRCYVDPFLTCRTCHQCRRGRKDICENSCLRGYFAVEAPGLELLKHYPVGGLAEYVVSPDANIAVLPPSISSELAARFGYVGTSFAALKKASVGPGKTILINGVTGTLGYAAVAIALGFGCTKILGIGRNRERLQEVQAMSQTGRVLTRSSEDDGDTVEWVKAQTNGNGVDVLIDCLGVGGDAAGTNDLVTVVKNGGQAILVAGGAVGEIKRSYWDAFMHEVTIVGSRWFTSADLDELIALIDSGVIDLSFIQHRLFPLDRVNDAFEAVDQRLGGAVNVVVQPGK